MIDYKSILNAIDNALGVVVSASDIPGVDLIPYVGTIAKVAKYAKLAVDAGIKEAPYVAALTDAFANGLPSEAVRAALDAKIEDMHTQIQGFSPTAEAGEEE